MPYFQLDDDSRFMGGYANPQEGMVLVEHHSLPPNPHEDYVLVNGEWVHSPIPTPLVWTPKQFLERFTQQERIALIEAARLDPVVEDFRLLCAAAREVINDDPVTVAGMDYLVSKGLITRQRADDVLGI